MDSMCSRPLWTIYLLVSCSVRVLILPKHRLRRRIRCKPVVITTVVLTGLNKSSLPKRLHSSIRLIKRDRIVKINEQGI